MSMWIMSLNSSMHWSYIELMWLLVKWMSKIYVPNDMHKVNRIHACIIILIAMHVLIVTSLAPSISVTSNIPRIPYCVITTAWRLSLTFFSFLVYKATMTDIEIGTSTSNIIENTVMPTTVPTMTPDRKLFVFTDSAISLDWQVVGSAPGSVCNYEW